METLRELSDAWSQRVRSPILGSFLISVILVNWQPFWYLFFAKQPVLEKFVYFEANTSLNSLLLLPLVIGFAAALALPWIKLLGANLVQIPTDRLRRFEHDNAHRQKIYKMEKSAEEIEVQARLDAAKERAKIDAARRLEEADRVGGDSLREEIQESRNKETDNWNEELSPLATDLLVVASSSNDGLIKLVSEQTEDQTRRTIYVGGRGFAVRSKRSMLILEEAVDQLIKAGFIDPFEHHVTLAGYEFLDSTIPSQAKRNQRIDQVTERLAKL